MIAVEYDTRNCPFCNEAILGKWLANCSLPIGKKVVLLDRFSGDPRNKLLSRMSERYGGVYLLPTILLRDKKSSVLMISVLNWRHLKTFLKEYNNII